MPFEQSIGDVLAESIPIKSGSGSLIVAVPKSSSIMFPALSVHKPLSLIFTEYDPPSRVSTVKICVVYETIVALAPPVVTVTVLVEKPVPAP